MYVYMYIYRYICTSLLFMFYYIHICAGYIYSLYIYYIYVTIAHINVIKFTLLVHVFEAYRQKYKAV